MKIYDDNGYVNIPEIVNTRLPFIFIIGGRGTGKTYGALKYTQEQHVPFLFMRRTMSEIESLSMPELNPFKKINSDTGTNIIPAPMGRHMYAFYNGETENGKTVISGAPVAPILALSTIANIRGFDASDKRLLIYDEFIPESHVKRIKNESSALFNAYETINRNRELNGERPLQMLSLSNSETLDNPIFISLGIVGKFEKMQRSGQEYSIDSERGIGMFYLQKSPISEMKSHTALYRATRGTSFAEMAIKNKFSDISDISIRHVPIVEYSPMVQIGEIFIYKHKCDNQYYVTMHKSGNPPKFGTTDIERQRAFRIYSYVWQSYFRNRVFFESSTCEILFNDYFKI